MGIVLSFALAAALATAPAAPPPAELSVAGATPTLPAGDAPAAAADAAVLPPPSPDTLLAVPPELKQLLRQKVTHYGAQEDRVQALVHLIFDEDALALRYSTEATHSVAETYQLRSANCLSFTLFFVALAREAGITARPQEVGQVLSWWQDQRTIYNFGHVNAQVRIDGRNGTVDLDASVLMDRRGPRVISDQRLFAHYYNNRGSELMAAGQNGPARQYYQQALRMDATLPNIWNNLGVLEAREGHLDAAGQDYAQALQLNPAHVASLSNTINLYRRLGNTAAADATLKRLEDIRAVDPFYHFMMGRQAESGGDYAQAISHYRRAVALHPAAHQFHFGLARAYFLSGNARLAEREMRRARDLGPENDRTRYQAKLDGLQRLERAGSLSSR
ncbi:tetratricopeptide repeat protein [Stenotrophomonas sp. HITSZ_GD]|uniref:tetratricopeptide repeat protein n=1 Tax=Stenotrophomonas sp. HITSZ_GD TaxID=3037248 RepID=UPI00240E76AD|nr:tetratricopeptide repeat protein [Stenotrophomonas sp. HITSZ_GD]MDG2527015.1 tetratricopeptide repeat protein [Stenotrophomonas sp. HITSZ_GD]